MKSILKKVFCIALGGGGYLEWRKSPRVSQLALKSRWDLLFTVLNSISFSSVLDVGCADGAILREVGERYGCRCYGCDLYEKEGVKERVANFIMCDAQKLPFNDGIFDLIISTEVIEHLPNPQSFLVDAHRILKKEGYLLISTPNWWRFTSLFGRINKKWSHQKVSFNRNAVAGRNHVREYTPKELQKMVEKSNFKIISMGFTHFNQCIPPFSLLDLPYLYTTLDRFTNIKFLKPITKVCQYLLARKSS